MREIGVKLVGSGFVAILGSSRETEIDKNCHFASAGSQNLYVFVPCFRTPEKTAKVRKKAPVFLTPERLEALDFRPPFGTTEGAGSGGEGFGEVPSPTESGKESGLRLTRQHPGGYGEFNRFAHSAGPKIVK